MLKFLPYLAVVLAIFFIPFNGWGSEEVLYWMVDDTSVVHYWDGTTENIVNLVPDAIDTSLAARVRVTGGGLSEDTFPDFYFSDPDDPYAAGFTWDGSMGIDFGESGGHWGCGVPVGNKSIITDFSSPEYSFIIELGNYHYDESTDTESWTTVASSASQSYSSLQGNIYTSFDISPPTTGIWNPHDFYAPLPEPNSFILLSIGISMLLLRRKRV